jgi:hypothetical protein
MSALAKELPHPYSDARWRWECHWCDTRGYTEAKDLVPDVCPECASARIWARDLWDPCIVDDDDDDFMEA